jgi:hypothetical protein
MTDDVAQFAPQYIPQIYTPEARGALKSFFTNLEKSVYVPLIFSPELIGALCSRTSRAEDDLRSTFLKEYILPFLVPERTEKDTDQSWAEKQKYSRDLEALLVFSKDHPLIDLFANPRARSFYTKWLAQVGDDSIAQMAGTHLVFTGLSQVTSSILKINGLAWPQSKNPPATLIMAKKLVVVTCTTLTRRWRSGV